MTRTEKLFKIFIFLLIIFLIYLFYVYNEQIYKFVDKTISRFKEQEVIVPYDKTVHHNNYQFQTVKETSNFKPNNLEDIKNIYYTVLNNGWTEFTFYCPVEYESCIDDVKLIADKNEYISQINNYVNPYNSYVKYNTLLVNDKEVHLTIDKLYTNDEIINIDNKINEIFSELNISTNNVTLENIKKLHDYILDNTSYDENYVKGNSTISNKATGALFSHIALCSGYSDTFAIMLDKMNVPNFRVSNDDHIWNAIYYNGKWYHIDVTWDDDEKNKNNTYNFYMISTNELFEKDKDIHSFAVNDYLELK